MDQSLSGWRQLLSAEYRFSVFIVCLCEAVPAGAGMIFGTILPATLDDIGGANFAAWALQVYAVAGIVGAAAMGRALTRFGFQIVAIVAGFAFIFGSLICALSPDFTIVLIGRAPQGFGAGLIGALGYALVKPLFPKEIWTRIFATLSAVWGIAAVAGPALGAAFISLGGWRAAFYALAVIGVFLTIAMTFSMKDRTIHQGDKGEQGPPLLRLFILGLGTFFIAGAGITEDLSWRLGLVATGLLTLGLMFRHDRLSTHSLLPKQSFNIRSPLGILLLLCFCMSISEMSYTVYGAIMLHKIYGYSNIQAGYGLVAFAMGWTLAEIISAHISQRFARYILLLGPLMMTGGMAIISFSVGTPPALIIVFGGFIMGSAMGTVWPHLISLTLQMAEDGNDAVIAGAVPTLQRLGLAIGAALAGVIANGAGLAEAFTVENMIAAGKWVHLGMMPPVIFMTALILRRWSELN
ncbi:MAG: MFS transporter [Sphingomonadales bacterium]|jgi:MFS family permease